MFEISIKITYIVPTYTGYKNISKKTFKNRQLAVKYVKKKLFPDLIVDEEDVWIHMIDTNNNKMIGSWTYYNNEITFSKH